MSRRLDRGALALVLPLLGFIAFGAARVTAPVSLIGLLFDHPGDFALAALVVTFAGAALLAVPAIELRVAGVLAPSRAPTPEEEGRLRRALQSIGARAGL